MEAKELRIGNYVHTTCAISGDNIVTEIEEINKQYANEGVSIDPIPLTEEWLERLGFEFYDYVLDSDEDIDDNETGIYKSYKKQPDGKKYYYSVNFNSDNTIEFTIKLRWADEMVLSLIKHVHQLQNLYFALTGEELTIEQ